MKTQSKSFAMSYLLVGVLAFASLAPTPAMSKPNDCHPGSGWTWVHGLARPEIAAHAQGVLRQAGWETWVTARDYAETNACGEYAAYAIDVGVLVTTSGTSAGNQAKIASQIQARLKEFVKPRLGNTKVTFQAPPAVFVLPASDVGASQLYASALMSAAAPSLEVFNRKVYVLVYDPLLSNSQLLSAYLGWSSHAALTQMTIDFFKQASHDKVRYTVVYTTTLTNGWPVKLDGFRYTEAEYLAVIAGQAPPHDPDAVDYTAIVNTPSLDICGKLNRGEIDELWIYNGPGFGFYESTLVGPGGYFYNSPPVPGPTACNRLMPIMGPSPEAAAPNAIHNFTHRMESTLRLIFGNGEWEQNRTANNWEKFALVKALSPDYSYSGCGNSHFPPNATIGYEYDSTTTVNSTCDDFANYPNLGDPAVTVKPVTCTRWDCTDIGFYAYWFGHFPFNSDCAPDGFANDWWPYFVDPGLALTPSWPCQSHVFLPLLVR